MRELNVVFADKYLSGYDLHLRRQNDHDLSEFVTNHLTGNAKDEYLLRRQMLKEKLDGNSDKLSQEILRLEQDIVELNDKHLHQIITRENIDSVFSISSTNENESEKLLAAFKECHLIDSYEESTTKAGYYKVARPKATKALSKEPSTVT